MLLLQKPLHLVFSLSGMLFLQTPSWLRKGWLLPLLPVSLNVMFSKVLLCPHYSKLWLYPPPLLPFKNCFPKYRLLTLFLLIRLLFIASLPRLEYVSLGQGFLFLWFIVVSQVPDILVRTQWILILVEWMNERIYNQRRSASIIHLMTLLQGLEIMGIK